MKHILVMSGVGCLVIGGLLPAHLGLAAIPAVYTNDNIWTSEHDRPVTITQDAVGNFYGTTVTGKTFSQTIVENNLSIKLMKFSIDEAYWYISDQGIIKAPSDMVAMSIYTAQLHG